MADYRKLRVWDRSTKLAVTVFKIAGKARKAGHVKLADQMEGSSESIGSNIAEGSAKLSQREYKHYLETALGSAFELETHLLIVKEQNWFPEEKINELLSMVTEEQKMVSVLISRIRLDA